MNKNHCITLSKYCVWVRLGWFMIDGKNRPWFQTTFAYSNYKNKAAALDAARIWRDDMLKVWAATRKTLNLKKRLPFFSGYEPKEGKEYPVGVYITEFTTLKKGVASHNRICIGHITNNKKKYQKTWSCFKYGDAAAVKMAAEWRFEQEKHFKKANALGGSA